LYYQKKIEKFSIYPAFKDTKKVSVKSTYTQYQYAPLSKAFAALKSMKEVKKAIEENKKMFFHLLL
jgi:hypothetical protein